MQTPRMILIHKYTGAMSITDKCLTFPQPALSYLQIECNATVITWTQLCQLRLFSALALCASEKTPRYVVTLPFWHWSPTCNADLQAAATEEICLLSVLSSASISTRPRYLHKSCSASGLPSCLLCFLSLGLLGTVPQQTAGSYWPNHKLRMYHAETQILSGRKKNWMRSWSPHRQEMRTLQPWKIH